MIDPLVLAQLIGSVGFPIVMSFYIVYRLEATVQENTKAIQQLRETIIQKHP